MTRRQVLTNGKKEKTAENVEWVKYPQRFTSAAFLSAKLITFFQLNKNLHKKYFPMARNIYNDILRDARVKLTEMFDRNFREQGFFGKRWQATKVSKTNKRGTGSILIVTGAMRRSIRSMLRGNGVVFSSHLPYTALHNEGGNFAVTVRAHSRISRKGNPYTVRAHQRQMSMPQRQFIGDHPKVQEALADIVNKNLQRVSQQLANKFNRR